MIKQVIFIILISLLATLPLSAQEIEENTEETTQQEFHLGYVDYSLHEIEVIVNREGSEEVIYGGFSHIRTHGMCEYAISPNGEHILLTAYQDGPDARSNIYIGDLIEGSYPSNFTSDSENHQLCGHWLSDNVIIYVNEISLQNKELVRYNLETGATQVLLSGGPIIGQPEVSPNSQAIIVGLPGPMYVFIDGKYHSVHVDDRKAIVDANTGEILHTFRGSYPTWGPLGINVVYRDSFTIKVMNLATDNVTILVELDHRPNFLSWSPDGNQIAFTMFVQIKDDWNHTNNEVFIFDLLTREVTQVTDGPYVNYRQPFWVSANQ